MSELEGSTREVVANGLRQLAAQGRGAFFSSTSLRTIATLLEAPCAEEIAAAKLETYETVMRELAQEIEEMSDHGATGAVTVWLEQATYETLQRYRQ